MADSLHQIVIHANAQTLYQALTLDEGIQSWWTDRCEMAHFETELCQFWFDEQQTRFTMQANKMLPGKRVFWVCLQGPDEWINTQLWWEIQPLAVGTCLLDFKHMNWTKDDGQFPLCNSTWGNLMQSLKQYCETGISNPWYRNLKASA